MPEQVQGFLRSSGSRVFMEIGGPGVSGVNCCMFFEVQMET